MNPHPRPVLRDATHAELDDVRRLAAAPGSRRERVAVMMRTWQERIVSDLEALDGQGRFREHSWDRPGGGGGRARVIEHGGVFERGGVNVSAVHGKRAPDAIAKQHDGVAGQPYFATGLSMVLHPVNPHVPSFHANVRYFEIGLGENSGVWWFGGGADLTPNYPQAEDAVAFHNELDAFCGRHAQLDYDTVKAVCDDYFTVRHRNEMRGIGGIFYDELSTPGAGDFEADFAASEDLLSTLMPAYLPVAERHARDPYDDAQVTWQRIRRGRYVEFNLVYDRGTRFGLETRGNIEAILMSMPAHASWAFDHQPEAGSNEALALPYFQPRRYAGRDAADVQAEIEAAAQSSASTSPTSLT
jgi:coproporphyrinogen III oxidase